MLWLEQLLHDVNAKIDCLGPKSMKLSPGKYLMGFSEADKSVPCSKFGEGARDERIYRVVCEFLSICLGFEPAAQGTRQLIASRFIHHLVDHAGPCTLLLDAVWKVFQRPNKFVVGTTSPAKIHLAPEELAEWQKALQVHPICDADSPEHWMLEAIGRQYDSIRTHKWAPPPSSPTAHRSPPVLIIWSNFFAWLSFINYPPSPIIASPSAHGYLPLLAPCRPLHQDRIQSVQGLFSMAQFRGTTYHSPFTVDHTFFQDPAAFFNAVRNLPL
ncbi:hypothetical protein C8J57DRAFT_1516014 [Mycena rebaudengoi]|nr:hypothetical protein C8J57DRAFT_1516014 [Mycena rebaudengoi]